MFKQDSNVCFKPKYKLRDPILHAESESIVSIVSKGVVKGCCLGVIEYSSGDVALRMQSGLIWSISNSVKE